MRLVIEIQNGCIQWVVSDDPCDVLIIDRDELAESVLPDGEARYMTGIDASVDRSAVDELFDFAGLVPS